MINKRAFLWACVALLVAFCNVGQAAQDDHHGGYQGHSDDLLLLLRHKIALQTLRDQQITNPSKSTLAKQGKHFRQVMPLLQRYMATPKSYYLTTQMYHDSLENRAAMLADFSMLLIQFQNQLVSPL